MGQVYGLVHFDANLCYCSCFQRYLQKITPVTQAIGCLFQRILPEEYNNYRKNFTRTVEVLHAEPFFGTTSNAAFLGSTLTCGCTNTTPHRYVRDIVGGWNAETCFHAKNLEGAYMELPQLGVQLELRQGDVVFFRGQTLLRAVSRVTNGVTRTGLTYWNHASTYNNLDQRWFDALDAPS